ISRPFAKLGWVSQIIPTTAFKASARAEMRRLMQLQGMFVSGSVSEHDPKDHSDGGSSNQTKDGNAGDGGRASHQQKTGNSHTQSPQNDANAHGVLQTAARCPDRHWQQMYTTRR